MIRSCDVVCAAIALLAGSGNHLWTPAVIFLYTAYSYMRSTREACITVFFVMLCALSQGVVNGYFYALGFTVFFTLLHMVKILNKNLYEWMPYIVTMVVIPYSIQVCGLQYEAMVMPVLVYGIMVLLDDDYIWIRRNLVLSQSLYGMLLLTAGYGCLSLFPAYQDEVICITLLLIACVCEPATCFLLGAAICFLTPINNMLWLSIPLILCLFKQKKVVGVLVFVVLGVVYADQLFLYVYVGAAAILLIFTKDRYIPLLARKDVSSSESRPYLSPQNIVKRQMQNYAGIFQSLAEYYSSVNDVEADLLGNMASALQYHAEEMQKIDDIGKDHERLQRALEGYQYEVDHLDIEEYNDGRLHIDLEIGNIKRGEIRTTLQPLLEVLLHRYLAIETLKSRRFTHGFHIAMCDHIPFEVEAYADSLKNSYTSSGDTFSIFRFRQSTICMISDGMGNGEHAARSSQLISSIFQRMMISGIPQDSAIRCINKLIQSDTYATLDVICFNRSKGVAYISKSAACPTFLLRDQRVYEISGNALPVGIVSQIEPDCFEIEMKGDDEFLMISDGVQESEIQTWLMERKTANIHEDVETFMEILKRKRRKDDSTLILSKIIEKE